MAAANKPPAPASAPTPSTALTPRRVALVTAGLMLSLFLAALDQTVVSTALPRIVSDLQGINLLAWVFTAYMVPSTIMTPISGKLGDLFGRKVFLIAGMVGFLGASMLCGQAQTMGQLVAFRAVQGAFGGILFATSFASVADLFDGPTRAKMSGLFGAVFGLSSVIGPALGGYITDNLSWRWVFYVNLPVGAMAIAFVAVTMPRLRSAASARDIDFLGAITLAAGLVPFLVALSITRDHSWTSPQVLGLLAVAVVFLVAFFFIEQKVAQPIVPFALFKHPSFTMSVLTGLFVFFAGFGSFVFVPLIYQGIKGASASNSGQLLTPMVLGMVVSSTIVGILMAKIRYYRFLGTGGFLLLAFGMWLLSGVTTATSSGLIVVAIITMGLGLGISFPLLINTVQNAMPRSMAGVATAQISFWQSVGGTMGIAILGSFLANWLPGKIGAEMVVRNIPQNAMGAMGGDPQVLFSPEGMAAARAATPPEALPALDQIVEAIRAGLASTLHDIWLVAIGMVLVAVVLSLFLKEAHATASGEPAAH